jgi:hypothetical protein
LSIETQLRDPVAPYLAGYLSNETVVTEDSELGIGTIGKIAIVAIAVVLAAGTC